MIMNKFDWIFFDLDGTLVDSIDIMYNIYRSFLKDFKIIGTKTEFNNLNGPSLKEIVIYLKKKYNFNSSVDELLIKYQNMINNSYDDVQPFKDSTKLLDYLKEKQYNLAIVSSTDSNIVQNVLKKNNWLDYFSLIVTGDEVKNSKPFPDIYNLCLSRTSLNIEKILVIEDSKNGYESATKAGLKCILLNKNINLKSLMSIC